MKVVPGKVQPGQRTPAETGHLTLTWQCPADMAGNHRETGELMLCIAAIQNLVPLAETQPEMQTFFREKRDGPNGEVITLAGIQVIYGGIDQLQKAFKDSQCCVGVFFF